MDPIAFATALAPLGAMACDGYQRTQGGVLILLHGKVGILPQFVGAATTPTKPTGMMTHRFGLLT